MADTYNKGIVEFRDKLKSNDRDLGKPELESIHKYSRGLAADGRFIEAAYMDIFDNIPPEIKKRIATMINGQKIRKEPHTNVYDDRGRSVQITRALNNTIVGTLEKEDQKGWHTTFFNAYVDMLMETGAYNKFTDLSTAISQSVKDLYGYWKVFDTEAGIKVAMPKHLVLDAEGGYNIDQNDWDESIHYMVMEAHREYKGMISLIAREATAQAYGFGDKYGKGMALQKDLADTYSPPSEDVRQDGRFVDEEGVTWEPLNPKDTKASTFAGQRYIGSNQYNEDWNKVYKHIINEEGGNIWIARINDSDDPSRIRLVIVKGNRQYSESIKIIGDLFGIDKDGKAVPISFSAEDAAKMSSSRQAWHMMNSDDDWWDGRYTDLWTIFARFFTDGVLPKWAEDEWGGRWTEAGGDFGVENIEYYHNKYSKDVEGSDYSKLSANAIGGKYLTEWSDPGRIEMDMYIDPLYYAIQTLQESKSKKLWPTDHPKKPYKITYQEFKQLYELVKSGLNASPNFFKGGTATTYFDSFFAAQPQSSREARIAKEFKLHTWPQAVRD